MILGITGTIGAGKGTVVDYLIKEKQFKHFSARNFITREIENRGIEASRDNMKMVANELRAKHTPSYIIEQLFKEAGEHSGNSVIESVRTVGEAGFLKEKGAVILAVDADIKCRYERIVSRGLSTDNVTFEEFCKQENAEMSNDDPNQQNIHGVMLLADYSIKNNSSLENLNKGIEKMFSTFMK